MTYQEALKILGLQTARSLAELHKIYRRKLAENHPDRFIRSKDKTLAHHRFILIQEAFKILTESNPEPTAPSPSKEASPPPRNSTPPTSFHPPLHDQFGYTNFESEGVVPLIFKSLSDLCSGFIKFLEIPILGWLVYWAANPCFGFIGICLALSRFISQIFYRLIFRASRESELVRLFSRIPCTLFIRPTLFASLAGTGLYYFIRFIVENPNPRSTENQLFCDLIMIAYSTPIIGMMVLEFFAALTSLVRLRNPHFKPAKSNERPL